jgi:hypothetical protein
LPTSCGPAAGRGAMGEPGPKSVVAHRLGVAGGPRTPPFAGDNIAPVPLNSAGFSPRVRECHRVFRVMGATSPRATVRAPLPEGLHHRDGPAAV